MATYTRTYWLDSLFVDLEKEVHLQNCLMFYTVNLFYQIFVMSHMDHFSFFFFSFLTFHVGVFFYA